MIIRTVFTLFKHSSTPSFQKTFLYVLIIISSSSPLPFLSFLIIPLSWLLPLSALPTFLFISSLTFNHQFIPFLDGNQAKLMNMCCLSLTRRQSYMNTHTHKQSSFSPSSQTAGYFSQFRQRIKDALHVSVSLTHCPSPSVRFLFFSLKTQVFIYYSWSPVCVFLS